jgi:gliding motility-associated-like protein
VSFDAVSNAGANYAWNFGDGKTSTEQNPDHAFETDNSGTPYNVTLTVSFGGACPSTDNDQITITAAPPIEITTTAPDYTICAGETITLSLDNSFTNPVWSTGSTAHSITVGEGGVYTVTATASNGCTLTDESNEVVKLPAPGVIVTADPQQIDEGASSQLNATGLDNYTWTPEEGLSDPDIENPVATPTVTTTYTVSGTDGTGCTGTATIQITVRGEAVVNKLEPMNFFSPNNSGHNDLWTINHILDFPQCEVTIYDDKGVKVFSAKPYQNDWNGMYNGKDLPDGVYYYVIRCDGEENSPRTGSITLIR